MKEVLAQAAAQFRHYEKLHSEKSPPDLEKARTNATMAKMCEDAVRTGYPLASVDLKQTLSAVDKLASTAVSLASYAMNLAHGATLEQFELEHVIVLAKWVGLDKTTFHERFGVSRRVLDEVMKERRAQIQIHGHTPEEDDAHPGKVRDAVLSRVTDMLVKEDRQRLVEAAAILVAEIERIDRYAAKEPAPNPPGLNDDPAAAERAVYLAGRSETAV